MERRTSTVDFLLRSSPSTITGETSRSSKVKASMAVEHLMDAANSALKKKDKNITAEIVDALCSFTIRYGRRKNSMF
jgi:hypothetical protein